MDFKVVGGEHYAALAKRLRKVGRQDLAKELTKAVRDSAKPIQAAQRREVRRLPSRGPRHTRLRARTAGATRLSVSSSGSGAAARIVVLKTKGLGKLPWHLNRGKWRKPVFGNRKKWVTQTMPPGWFDRPARAGAPHARREIEKAAERIARKAAG